MLNKDSQPMKFYFIAIGGVGMSGLAKYLIELGYEVSGSDVTYSKYCKELEEAGAKIHIGHDASNVPSGAVVIASSAIKADNVEFKRAKELGLEILHRSDVLKLISSGFGKEKAPSFIGFSGTHGKTTTSGLCSYVLLKSGMEPSFSVGGLIPDYGINALCSKNGKYFIAELDESDGSIIKYKPDTLVVNNLEADHLDFYKNGLEDVLNTFTKVLSNLSDDAHILVNTDSFGCRELIARNSHKKILTFGINSGDFQARNIISDASCSEFDVFYGGKSIISVRISILGEHNIYNALAVIAALYVNGEDVSKFKEYFCEFSGMGRRFQKKAEFGGIKVFDDYAHHPTEIKATLSGVRTLKNGENRIVTIFQPHRYTRLKALWNEFAEAFSDTDELIITDVYSAGDKYDDVYNAETFSKVVKNKNVSYYGGSISECAEKIMHLLKKNDIVITMGAGDITKMGDYLTELYNDAKRS